MQDLEELPAELLEIEVKPELEEVKEEKENVMSIQEYYNQKRKPSTNKRLFKEKS